MSHPGHFNLSKDWIQQIFFFLNKWNHYRKTAFKPSLEGYRINSSDMKEYQIERVMYVYAWCIFSKKPCVHNSFEGNLTNTFRNVQ